AECSQATVAPLGQALRKYLRHRLETPEAAGVVTQVTDLLSAVFAEHEPDGSGEALSQGRQLRRAAGEALDGSELLGGRGRDGLGLVGGRAGPGLRFVE